MEYLYGLPFDVNKHGINISQGRNGPWSHKLLPNGANLSQAVDFALPLGTEVLAARAGVVMGVIDFGTWCERSNNPELGLNPPAGVSGVTNLVMILHEEDSTSSVYSHLNGSRILVATGTRVNVGETIAVTGESGWLGSIPHLHFQVDSLNPRTFHSTPLAVRFSNYSGPLEHSELFP